MGHTITASRGCTHAVVGMDGDLMSSHRSEQAAQRAIDREVSQFRASPYGGGGAYLPRSIIPVDADGTAYIERTGRHSTGWSRPEAAQIEE